MKRTNPEFINGIPELLILRLLSRRPMHGYELIQRIKASSGESLEFGEGCVYPLLHRLEAEGMIASAKEPVGGRTRVVYRVTPRGKERFQGSADRWERVVSAVRQVLEAPLDEHPALG